jgi:hypothetical protein
MKMIKTKPAGSSAASAVAASTRWVDKQQYTFADVVALSEYNSSFIHGLRIRKAWTTAFPQSWGGAVRATYTARDILHLMAVAAGLAVNMQVPFGDNHGTFQESVDAMVAALDKTINVTLDLGVTPERIYVFPRPKAKWCKVSFDLKMLVDTQLQRLREYKP